MDNEILSKIDSLIEDSTPALVADTIKFVNIKSVKGQPLPGAPFGEGPKKMLDAFLEMSAQESFYCTDYNVGVVSASLKEGTPDLGIWLHGDVVPEGDGWDFEPYNAVEYKGCIVGRGATDNKGQLASIFNLFKIFRNNGIELKYNPAIYLGSNEETGMKDIIGVEGNPDAKGFINVCTPPALSLVPDGGFPVGYGGKGGMNLTLRSRTPLHGFSFIAGQPEAPGRASAVFERNDIPNAIDGCTIVKGEKTEISTFTPPRHGASPDPNGNMITNLSAALLDSGLVCDDDRYILEFFRDISSDIYGKNLGIETSHDVVGKLTVFSGRVSFENGYPELSINIRYPVGITFDEIVKRVKIAADERGFTVTSSERGVNPYLLDPNSDIVNLLLKASNDVTGENGKPFTMGGGTYAHRLSNAYVFGMSGCCPPAGFPSGRGGAHGIDEVVSLARLRRAMKIYARAMLALNDVLGK